MTKPTYDENGNLTGATKEMVEDTIIHNGVAYTMNSNEAKHATTNWKWIRGYTLKQVQI